MVVVAAAEGGGQKSVGVMKVIMIGPTGRAAVAPEGMRSERRGTRDGGEREEEGRGRGEGRRKERPDDEALEEEKKKKKPEPRGG